jgi:Na+/melibiose symporter-like transporter
MLPDRKLYGQQALFSTVGVAIITTTVGAILDSQHEIALKEQYRPLFYIYSVTTALFCIVFYFIVPKDNPQAHFAAAKLQLEFESKSTSSVDSASSTSQMSIWKQTVELLSNPKFAILLLIAVVFGYGMQNMVSI